MDTRLSLLTHSTFRTLRRSRATHPSIGRKLSGQPVRTVLARCFLASIRPISFSSNSLALGPSRYGVQRIWCWLDSSNLIRCFAILIGPERPHCMGYGSFNTTLSFESRLDASCQRFKLSASVHLCFSGLELLICWNCVYVARCVAVLPQTTNNLINNVLAWSRCNSVILCPKESCP